MIVFQNKNEFAREKINEEEDTVSTLLIPLHLKEDFLLKLEKHNGNASLYFRSLLRRHRTITHSGMLPEPEKIKTEYQVEGLHLQKFNFRPRNADWIELGELALAFGKSRCFVFVYLLELDLLGLWRVLVEAGLKKVVPTLPSLELKSFWKLRRIAHYFGRGYHVKV